VKAPALALTALLALGAAPHSPLGPARAPADVLTNYLGALADLPKPPALEFEYSVEQLGLHNLEQTHHVFRAGQSERDETVSIDGYKLKRPSVRILLNRTNRYDVTALAPKPSGYAFAPAEVVPAGGHFNYVFDTFPKGDRPFAITRVTIDGELFLPTLMTFRITAGGTRASGRVSFMKSDRYFVAREATADAKLNGGAVAHERIVWSKYQFPAALPPSTFAVPQAAPGSAAIEP
jgi:hypothetical protein